MLLILPSHEAFAAQTEAVLVSTDDDGYTYAISGGGTFTTNCRDGETKNFVYLETDNETKIISVKKDGAEIEDKGGFYYDPGVYELVVESGESRCSFRFTISDSSISFLDSSFGTSQDFNIVREPDVNFSYDSSRGLYRYTLPDGEWIECNVPQGGFTRNAVTIRYSDGLSSLSSYKDGEIYLSENTSYKEAGSYNVTIWDLGASTEGGVAYRFDYCFNIYQNYDMNISVIRAPGGMRIKAVEYNGEYERCDDDRKVVMRRDGNYRIRFEGISDPGAVYSMELTRDTSPPKLIFTPDFKNGDTINEDLYFARSPEVKDMVIHRDGVLVGAEAGRITVVGQYLIEVSDEAGNTRSYEFILKPGLPLPKKQMVILLVILLVVGVGVFLHGRRNMKVL